MGAITNITHGTGLIVARLRDQLPEDVRVERMTEFSEIEFSAWPAPAVYVLFGQITPQQAGGYANVGEVLMDQVFHVVPVVDNSMAIQGGGGPDEEGGTLAALCIKALHNWTMDDRFDPLSLQPGSPIDFAPGRLMFPLSFQTSTALLGHIDIDL